MSQPARRNIHVGGLLPEPFSRRGAILDEQLHVLDLRWRQTPASFHGEFFSFGDVYFEPKAYRPSGPALWFGGERLHGPLSRRLVRYGSGFHPLGVPAPADLERLGAAMRAAGRSESELELIGGTRAVFPDDHSCADLGEAMAWAPSLVQGGQPGKPIGTRGTRIRLAR